MAFSDFRNYDQVIEKYRVNFLRDDFIAPAEKPLIDENFRQEMRLNWREFPYERSEAATSQSLIFPILREVWKSYRDHLLLMSQEPLVGDGELTGVVDFVVCKRSSLGPTIP